MCSKSLLLKYHLGPLLKYHLDPLFIFVSMCLVCTGTLGDWSPSKMQKTNKLNKKLISKLIHVFNITALP